MGSLGLREVPFAIEKASIQALRSLVTGKDLPGINAKSIYPSIRQWVTHACRHVHNRRLTLRLILSDLSEKELLCLSLWVAYAQKSDASRELDQLLSNRSDLAQRLRCFLDKHMIEERIC